MKQTIDWRYGACAGEVRRPFYLPSAYRRWPDIMIGRLKAFANAALRRQGRMHADQGRALARCSVCRTAAG
jgi:hypothetical protein